MPTTRTFPPINITEPRFPYAISEEGTNPSSFITIGLADPFSADEFGLLHSNLFYIAGGEIHTLNDSRTGMPEHQVILRHSFAGDIEGSRSQLAVFRFKGLQFAPSYRKSVSFAGWLTAAQFYPVGYEDEQGPVNPFLGEVKQEEIIGHENYGFPYSPPTVAFGFQLPLEVSVTLHHNQSNVQEHLTEIAGK